MKDSPTIHLLNPDELSVDNAYRSLPRMGVITIETSFPKLDSQLEMLEQKGFAGIHIMAFGSVDERIIIKAYKGKQGICYDTGRSARYMGAALTAVDDDHHLLFSDEEVPVCEKTATLYSLPCYRDLINCSEGDKGLLENLSNNPILFDCDNYEESLEKLFSMVRGKKQPEEFTNLFYPGPFKLLVLKDGSIIHRGRINKVPVEEYKRLMKNDGLFRLGGQPTGQYESFVDLFQVQGPRCLLKNPQPTKVNVHDPFPDLTVLKTISRGLKNRMLRILESQKDYFILTGSNREDEYGCCPSDEVTEADNLVKAGILSASRESTADDACPVTIYAFRNEIVDSLGQMQFNQNSDLRQDVYKRLKNNRSHLLKITARWALLGFVIVTLILALTRIYDTPAPPRNNNGLHTRLDVPMPNSTILVLFHYKKRCEQCLAMEKYAREVLEDNFHEMLQQKQIQFRQAVMDLEENRNFIERFGLFTSTLVIIKFEDMEEDSIRVLDRSWTLYTNEMEFKKMLTEELNHMIGHEYD
ncbi:hypothetical protein GF312_03510 [Candidatus Poribacteria bacterium]|nr:hypothetical protein [Candidatus Poribacteria bacterium]